MLFGRYKKRCILLVYPLDNQLNNPREAETGGD
jgi:hypothetical protein